MRERNLKKIQSGKKRMIKAWMIVVLEGKFVHHAKEKTHHVR